MQWTLDFYKLIIKVHLKTLSRKILTLIPTVFVQTSSKQSSARDEFVGGNFSILKNNCHEVIEVDTKADDACYPHPTIVTERDIV